MILKLLKSPAMQSIANRWSEGLADAKDKVFTRDLFKRD